MNKRALKGLSLIEIIVVIAIIMTLLGILVAVIVPRAKESARIAQNRSQLRQVAVAINLYMVDWDDVHPIRLEGIVEEQLLYDHQTCVPYMYHLGAGQLQQSGLHPSEFGFDEAVHPVVVCTSCSRHTGAFSVMQYPCKDGRMSTYKIPQLEMGGTNYVLGAKLSGGTGYFAEPPDWFKNLPEPPQP